MDAIDAVTVDVRVPLALRRLTGGASSVKASGRTIGEALEDLERRYAGFRERLLDGGAKLKDHMVVYRNGEDVRYQAGLETRLAEGDRIQIVPAMAGG